MNNDQQITLLLQSIIFAEQAHRGQLRKGEAQEPYIGHPLAVLALLWEHGVRDVPTLCAAVLHDVVEDTAVSAAEIEATFGPTIAAIVQEVTDDKSLPKVERKRLQVAHAPHKSPAAAQLKIADKICNLRDLWRTPPPDWSAVRRQEYVAWATQVVAGLRGHNPSLEAAFDAAVAQFE